jgi:hypothetical protein
MKRMSRVFIVGVIVLLTDAATASAQVLGTFRWQFAPYCNVVTLLVEQKGSLYELTGTDDGCNGAAPAAAVNGSAHLNAGGAVGMSLTLVRPDSLVVSAAINLNPTTLNGTWRDNWSNSGVFTFNPVLPVAAPPRRLTMRGNWSVVFPAAAAGNVGSGSLSFQHALPAPPAAGAANVMQFGAAPTVNCPGTVGDPQAAPGQVCIYERVRINTNDVVMFAGSTGQPNQADVHGVSVLVTATAAGTAAVHGGWAVTVP